MELKSPLGEDREVDEVTKRAVRAGLNRLNDVLQVPGAVVPKIGINSADDLVAVVRIRDVEREILLLQRFYLQTVTAESVEAEALRVAQRAGATLVL